MLTIRKPFQVPVQYTLCKIKIHTPVSDLRENKMEAKESYIR